MRTQSVATPADVERLLIERYRAMGPGGRLAAALELNAELELLALDMASCRPKRRGCDCSP